MIGFMVTPDSDRAVLEDVIWAADCGLKIAKSTDPSDVDRYLSWLARPRGAVGRALFAVAPDVLGDAAATWARSSPLLPRIRALGYPAAFVAQDGFDPSQVDWDAFDVLFIGGDPATRPEWKRREDGGYAAIAEGKRRGKRVHVGRVNGAPFLRNIVSAGADSADGTMLRFGPDRHWPRVVAWCEGVRDQPPLPLEAV